ncbi:hypothetical protein BT69DRAFT_1291249 [Atractiella rhizophila]|nr:hypothetical protein BT69DRAFT_1291249 [Atractiella rhizophila]
MARPHPHGPTSQNNPPPGPHQPSEFLPCLLGTQSHLHIQFLCCSFREQYLQWVPSEEVERSHELEKTGNSVENGTGRAYGVQRTLKTPNPPPAEAMG